MNIVHLIESGIFQLEHARKKIVGKDRLKVLDLRNYLKRNQSHSLVGTDNYMAPEVIRGTGQWFYTESYR